MNERRLYHSSHVVEGRTNCLNCGTEAWHPAIGRQCPNEKVMSAPRTELELVRGAKVDVAHAVTGDPIRSEDGQTRYRAERHASGRVTLHRAERKLSKAEKKQAKRARQAQRNRQQVRVDETAAFVSAVDQELERFAGEGGSSSWHHE